MAQPVKNTQRFHPSWIVIVVLVTFAIAAIMWFIAKQSGKEIADATGHTLGDPSAGGKPTAGQPAAGSRPAAGPQAQPVSGAASGPADANMRRAVFTPPAYDAMPEGPFGDAVRLGHNIFVDTQTYAKAYVGNGLNCVNCHLDAGRKPDSAPLWAAYSMFPAYRDKNRKVNSYEDRLTGCFRFSMNGKAPPPGSKELIALMSYSFWLAKGAPTGEELPGRGYPIPADPLQTPDAKRGEKLFMAQCAICHGADGQGTKLKTGRYAFPPLWGNDSFNGGAGMSKDHNAAAFIQANMPLGQGGTLSDQEAWDIARYMNSHTRPPDPRKKGE